MWQRQSVRRKEGMIKPRGLGALLLALILAVHPAFAHEGPAKRQLLQVQRWLLLLNNTLEPETVTRIAGSKYDMVVVDDVATRAAHRQYDMAGAVAAMHARPNGAKRLVLAYLNVGRAEDYRNYFQPDWAKTPPEWFVGTAPGHALGGYPVAYWTRQWHFVLTAPDGLLDSIVKAGFDGVYLDWAAAYWDPRVRAKAEAEGVDPRAEMVSLLGDIASTARAGDGQFLLVVQNAPDLADLPEVRNLVDGVAQQDIWFTGADNGMPPGDCPLPRVSGEPSSVGYLARLPPACRAAYESGHIPALDFAPATEVVPYLTRARHAGLAVFTADAAFESANIKAAVERSQALGFKPFIGGIALAAYRDPAF